MTAVMLAVAWVVHRLVERPLGRVLRSSLRRGMQDIRSGTPTPSRPTLDRLPAQSSAPEAERVPAVR
ncbi:hypothetical protein ACU4GG_06730 [Streptomyces nojiriensis]